MHPHDLYFSHIKFTLLAWTSRSVTTSHIKFTSVTRTPRSITARARYFATDPQPTGDRPVHPRSIHSSTLVCLGNLAAQLRRPHNVYFSYKDSTFNYDLCTMLRNRSTTNRRSTRASTTDPFIHTSPPRQFSRSVTTSHIKFTSVTSTPRSITAYARYFTTDQQPTGDRPMHPQLIRSSTLVRLRNLVVSIRLNNSAQITLIILCSRHSNIK